MSATIPVEIVHRQLQGLDSLRSAREMFAELNYEPALRPIVIPATAPFEDLPEPPQVIAERGDFRVIYTRLASDDRLPRGAERPIVEQLLHDHEYSLFLFSDEDESHWDLVNVKLDLEKNNRRVHRRISIRPDDRRTGLLRTATERLARIALPDDDLDRFERFPLAIQELHDEAFDVEHVTRKFYTTYREVFELVEQQVQGINDEGQLRYFTQRLFNRLMFLAFVQKKGWLKLDGDTDYLNMLWNRWKKSDESGTFYNRRLKLLFFTALDNPAGHDYMDDHSAGSVLRSILGEVRYLNGGLFEKHQDDKSDDIIVPDPAIKIILERLFNSFNFTVEESTTLDVEVAVDPEMLGKVFEELVTGRHDTGSYYTPKPIVSFMCREALKTHLTTKLPGESSDAIESLVDDDYNAEMLRDPEGVLAALRAVTVCDPACGSGAYLLGMLHELLDVRRALFVSRNIDPQSEYDRKLEIIQSNIYGVDIDPFAANIARLRLWLSLAVDYEGETPRPLPNLDLKIEIGDSVADAQPRDAGQLGLRDTLIEELAHWKSQYLDEHGSQKEEMRRTIEAMKQELSDFLGRPRYKEWLDWSIEYPEVFANNGGFDIVITNPPYGARIEKSTWDRICRWFPNARSARNSAAAFLALPKSIGSANVIVAQIVPKSIAYSAGWSATRSIIWEEFDMQLSADVSEAFERVLLEQEIVIYGHPRLKTGTPSSFAMIEDKIVKTESTPLELMKSMDVIANHLTPSARQIVVRIGANYRRLSEFVTTPRGKGWQQHLSDNDGHNPIHAIQGVHVRQFAVSTELPTITLDRRRREQFRTMDQPKLVCQNIIAHVRNPYDTLVAMCAIDRKGHAVIDTVNMVIPREGSPYSLEFLCALINSSFVRWYLYFVVFNRAVRTMHFDAPYMGNIPIPKAESPLISQVERLALEMEHKAAQGDKYYLHGQESVYDRIDELVFQMFELSPAERREVLRD